jgi:hypothetical protein
MLGSEQACSARCVSQSLIVASALSLLLLAGCISGSPGIVDGNVNPDPTLAAGKRISGEPNDSFSDPLDLILNSSGIGYIQGTVATTSDVDVYDMGAVEPGDRIRVDLAGAGGLDAAIAIFDDQGRLFVENDDRDFLANQLNPFVNEQVRHAGTKYYLAVASAPLAPTTGSYTATLTGGSVTIPGDRTYTVGVFNTADIDPAYAGMTNQVRVAIVNTVKSNYEGLDLQLYTTSGTAPPAGTPFSTVLFGGESFNAYGVSQAVDEYNANPTDASIIFTDTFRPSYFGRVLTADELGRAIGNVASHEMGHLLGLNHVDNVTDIMDTTGGAITFLLDQMFKLSPLDDTIWPFGYQDGLLLLTEILGT